MKEEAVQFTRDFSQEGHSRYIDLAMQYLEAGEEQKAREIVLKHRNRPCAIGSIHRRWAEVCEELGLARHAQESYERALKIAPYDMESLYRLGLLLYETGQDERALHYLRKALKRSPEHKKVRELVAHIYRTMGFSGQAEVLAPQAAPKAEADGPRYFPPSVGVRDTDLILRLFAGREVGYSLQHLDSETGETAYLFQSRPLTHDILAAHIRGDISLAVYPLRSDNTVHYTAISVRTRPDIARSQTRNKGYLSLLEEKARSHTIGMARLAEQMGLRAYAEETGAGGYRLWFFFEDFPHFLKVRRFVKAFLEKAPAPEGAILVEPLFATRGVGIGWVEHPLLLPLGINRPTLRRSLFLDSEGRPHAEQLKFLRTLRPVKSQSIGTLLQSSAKGEAGAEPPRVRGTVNLLARRCPVLKELAQKAKAGRILRREEKVVLFYTIGVADRDTNLLHDLLESCPDYNYDRVQQQWLRLKSNPVSCPKIRALIPEVSVAVNCECTFDLRGGKYPSPLLHISPHLVPTVEELAFPVNLPAREAARRYVNLLYHLEEVTNAMKRVGATLEEHHKKSGALQIKVDCGILRRSESGGQVTWRLERV